MTSFKELEQLAEKILEENGLLDAPVDVYKLADKLSILVTESDPEDENLSGALIRGQSSKVLINSKHPETRRRFTLGHEIGHYLIHPNQANFVDGSQKGQVQVLFRRGGGSSSEMEREANRFAAALLMPPSLLKKEIAKFTDEQDQLLMHLSDIFDVSKEAMGYRLLDLGYTNAG